MPEFILRAHVWTAATFLPLLVRWLPLRRLLKMMTPPTFLRPYASVSRERIVAIVEHRLRTPRNMRRRACLRRGLMLFHFLRLAGCDAVLQFGVFPPGVDANRMHGHCWVTVAGECIADPPGEDLAVVMTHGTEETPPADSTA